jgi:hypothetical protein
LTTSPPVSHDPHVVGKMAAHIVLPWVHRIFSNLKVWDLGVYHGLRRRHLQSYLDEFVFRFNRGRTRHAALVPTRDRRRPPAAHLQNVGLTGSKGISFCYRYSFGCRETMATPQFMFNLSVASYFMYLLDRSVYTIASGCFRRTKPCFDLLSYSVCLPSVYIMMLSTKL